MIYFVGKEMPGLRLGADWVLAVSSKLLETLEHPSHDSCQLAQAVAVFILRLQFVVDQDPKQLRYKNY
jgi:hypothetical protein